MKRHRILWQTPKNIIKINNNNKIKTAANKNRRNYLYYLWWLNIVADYKTDDRQQFIVEGLCW